MNLITVFEMSTGFLSKMTHEGKQELEAIGARLKRRSSFHAASSCLSQSRSALRLALPFFLPYRTAFRSRKHYGRLSRVYIKNLFSFGENLSFPVSGLHEFRSVTSAKI
jgi:hypothetical protein